MTVTRPRGALLGIVLALATLLTAAAPAAAYQVVSETGLLGPYTFSESAESPRARCGYSAYSNDKQFLRFMRLGPPTVMAADRDSDKRDSRIVGWRFLIQRLGTDLTTWSTVAKSPIQKARAYEDAAAALSAMRVDYSASKLYREFRALVVINFYRPNGTVEGRAKLTPQHYQFRDPGGAGPTMFDTCPSGVQRV